MFFGRQEELKKLSNLYYSDKFECVILHGRLRMGKTSLLREFMQGKEKSCIYFAAQQTSDMENLEALMQAVRAFPRFPAGDAPLNNQYEDVFERLGRLAKTERVVLIIDEYQFLVGANKGISELICKIIEGKLTSTQFMLILCGSSEAVMEAETLGYSTFYGKRTAQIQLKPFNFFEVKKFYSGFSPFDIAVIYGITSGVPYYMNMMQSELTVEENIKQTFFNPGSKLFEEPENFLRREVRDPVFYNAVLKAIATGCTKNSEIAESVGLETSACTAYLKNLMSFGLVAKHTPVTERAGKKTIYEIEDSMFRFWYRFVPDHMSLIQSYQVDRIWRVIAQQIPSFMDVVFKDICRQWVVWRNDTGSLGADYAEIGRWWGFDFVTKCDTAIPIVAYSADDKDAIFGDAVWSDDPMDVGVLRFLEERSRLFRFTNRHLYLFSRSGFTEECTDFAMRLGVNLVMFE